MLMPNTLTAVSDPNDRICPKCQTANEPDALEQRQYRCAGCGLELAHLDMAANGAVRGIFGWVLAVGTLVSERYQVAAVLGKGGFGVTYLVDDIRLAGKRRALKEIPTLLFDEYETRLLGRLNHPAIPDIIDRFEVDGMVYLVLEFGGSRTLRIEMERQGGRIPVFLLLPWIEQLCAALIYLHSQDPPVIHRDLKPENILLDENDRVMLIDFGIAKESNEQNVTRTLGRAVTHGFSPPEQVLGTGTDARSDVYALGAILYCAITGRVPPAAHERITGTVLEPPSRFFPELPPLFDAAICQALELNLHKRQQCIAELAQCLDLVRSGGGSARTVFAADTGALASTLRATEAVRLASVEFPSVRQSNRVEIAPSSLGQPLAAPAPPSRPNQTWAWLGMGLAGVLLAGGGWLYWSGANQGPAGDAQGQAAVPASATAPVAQTPGGVLAPLPTASPVSPGVPAPITTDAPGAAAPGEFGQPAGLPAQPLPLTSAPALAPGAPDPDALPPATALPPPTRSTADSLPSVFSSEQQPAGPTNALPRGSLMDEYEKYRAQQGQAAPSVSDTPTPDKPAAPETPAAPDKPAATTANVKPQAKSPKSATPTKPKAATPARRDKKKTKVVKKPQQAPPSSSFVIRDKGVRRTD